MTASLRGIRSHPASHVPEAYPGCCGSAFQFPFSWFLRPGRWRRPGLVQRYPGSPLQPPPESPQEDFGIMVHFVPHPLRQGKQMTRKKKSRGSPDSLNLDEVHFTSLSRFFPGSGRACRHHRTPCAGFIARSRTMCFVGRVELPKLNRVIHCNHFFSHTIFSNHASGERLRSFLSDSHNRPRRRNSNCARITAFRKISGEITLRSGYLFLLRPAFSSGRQRPTG